MLRPRFQALELRYGCHDAQWEIPDVPRPVVIAGRNGSGKSTLVDGLVRTLFGFDRRRGEDADELAARDPWGADGMRGRLLVAVNGHALEVARDFHTDRVAVRDAENGEERFSGDGNPAARNQEARHYRRILTDLMGLGDLEAYRRTLLVRQGELPEATLGDHLLRIAAGGHARVETARRDLAEAHRRITRRPLHPDAVAAINPRELEKTEDEIRAVEQRLSDARAARDRRAPLTLDRDRTTDRLSALDREIELLEAALSALARTDATEINTRHLRQHVHELGRAARQVRDGADELDAARAARRDADAPGRYPTDLPERIARAQVHWQTRDDLARVPPPAVGVLAALFLAAAGGLLALDRPLWSAIAAGVGLLVGVPWAVFAFWSRRRRDIAAREIHALTADLPHADALAGGETGEALRAFRAQRQAEDRMARTRDDLADALREARAALRRAGRSAVPGSGVDAGVDGGRRAGGRPRRLARHLEAVAEATREKLARGRLELDRIGDVSLALPADVPPTESAVQEALRDRRADRAEVQETLQDINRELLDRGTPGESLDALERTLARLRDRHAELDLRARVLEDAHALLVDAYDAFRDRDQERLAEGVSEHVRALTARRLDGIRVEDSLDEASVRSAGRLLPMRSPPLSFGELHALHLGIRLGAADFLAGVGVLPPLVIDEPFAHLDTRRATAVWRILHEVARSRQVLVTTQDDRLLDHLEVRPDIRLSRDG